MKSLSTFLGIIFLFLLGCATLTTPNGGPKDTAPPMVIATTPQTGQVNFQGKTVELVFDELVKLNKPKEEIIISPSPGKEVDILVKKDRVTITPKSGWEPNTTYSISFREGVQDITENNNPRNLKLAFSTGPTIDSLRISGHVKYVLKNTDADKITVALFQQDTFDIFTDAPSYLTQTDKAGNYRLENLKQGTYSIYAFEDKSKNLKVESRTEPYGFVAETITLNHDIDSVDMGLVMMDSRKLKVNSIRNLGNITRIRFNKYLREYSIKADSDIVNHYGDNQTEINFWNPKIFGDSIKQELFATDSLDFTIDTVFYIKRTETKPFQENLKFSLGLPAIESETGKFTTVIQFSKPVIDIDFDSLIIDVTFPPVKPKVTPAPKQKKPVETAIEKKDTLTQKIVKKDSVISIPISKNDITLNLQKNQIIVTKELNKDYFKGETDPLISFRAGKSAFVSIENDTTKKALAQVPITWPEDTGILHFEINTRESAYVIQLLNTNGEIVQSTTNTPKGLFKNLTPGEYQLRVVIDKNKNGKWDPGNFYKKIPEEKIIYYKDPKGKQSFVMRANWEYGPLNITF